MCGAFSILHPFRDLSGRFNAGYNEISFPPRYNARPSQKLPVILNTDPKEIILATWGYMPPWSTSQGIINARKESLDTKPMYFDAIEHRRCLILADGFYEWAKMNKKKVPFRFTLKNEEPFAFAGIWSQDKNTSLATFAIITTEPNDLVEKVHDRMPAILQSSDEKEWLRESMPSKEAITMLNPYPAEEMLSYEVSTLVNSPKNNTIDIIKPARI